MELSIDAIPAHKESDTTRRGDAASAVDPGPTAEDTSPGAPPHPPGRAAPIVVSLVFLAAGAAFFFGWGPLVLHRSQWTTGGDLWGIARAAHYVGWGWFGGIYDPSTGVITFPGVFVLLTPVAMVSGALGLTESFSPNFLLHPTSALLFQPAELLLGLPIFFAVRSVAIRFGVGRRKLWVLLFAVGVLAFPAIAAWGHVEDILAVALGLYGFRAVLTDRLRNGGWLLGLAIAMQPLVALTAPMLVGVVGAGRRLAFVVRAALPATVLLGIALAGNWSDVIHALVKQPTPPNINHATPWIRFAPRISLSHLPRTSIIRRAVLVHGHFTVTQTVVHLRSLVLVSGGPVRAIGVGLSLLVGGFVWKKRPDAVGLLWLFAVCLALRCYFEPVMTPYYLAPPLMVGLIAASRFGWWRFALATAAACGDTFFAYERLSPWVWWLPVIGMLTVVIACGYPGRRHLLAGWAPSGSGPEVEPAEDQPVPPDGIQPDALGSPGAAPDSLSAPAR